MKKIVILIFCLIAMTFLVSCEDGKEEETSGGFQFSENLLPSEVSIGSIESLGYTLMPSDGENLLYKYHNDSDGVSEMQFTYIKTNELGSESFITVNVKLFNAFLKGHDDIIDSLDAYGVDKSKTFIDEGDGIIKNETATGYVDTRVLRNTAIVENGVTTGEVYEAVNGIYVHTTNLYTVKIESSFLPASEADTVVDSAKTYIYKWTGDYNEKVQNYKAQSE